MSTMPTTYKVLTIDNLRVSLQTKQFVLLVQRAYNLLLLQISFLTSYGPVRTVHRA
jgi:hypothetical protein